MDIDSFTEEILGIVPSFNSVNPFGDSAFRMPIVGSRAAGAAGGSNASTDLSNNLQRAAIQFSQAYKQPDVDAEQLKELAQKIEGPLMMEETLSVLSKQKVDHLIDGLHTLVEAKNGA